MLFPVRTCWQITEISRSCWSLNWRYMCWYVRSFPFLHFSLNPVYRTYISTIWIFILNQCRDIANNRFVIQPAPATSLLPHGIGVGKKMTAYPCFKPQIAEKATYSDEVVVEDGRSNYYFSIIWDLTSRSRQVWF